MFSRYVIMTLILIGVGVAFYPSPKTPTVTILPDISFTVEGQSKSLQDYQGTLTLIHFWATWCPPCLAEMPELIKLAHSQPNIKIIAFSLDKTERNMQRYFETKFKNLPANFISVWDENGTIAQDEFYSFNYPETYIMGCSGNIDEKVIGAASNWPRTLKPHLKNCLK